MLRSGLAVTWPEECVRVCVFNCVSNSSHSSLKFTYSQRVEHLCQTEPIQSHTCLFTRQNLRYVTQTHKSNNESQKAAGGWGALRGQRYSANKKCLSGDKQTKTALRKEFTHQLGVWSLKHLKAELYLQSEVWIIQEWVKDRAVLEQSDATSTGAEQKDEELWDFYSLLKKSLGHVLSAKKKQQLIKMEDMSICGSEDPHLSDHTPLKAAPRNVSLNFSVQPTCARSALKTWPWADPTGHKTSQTSALSFVLRNSNKSEMIFPLRLSVFTSFTSLWYLMALKGDKKLILDFFFLRTLFFLRRNFNTSSSSSGYDTHINFVVFFLQVHQWPFQRQLGRGVGAGWQLQVSGFFSKLKQLLQLQSTSHSTQTRQVPAEPPADPGHGLHLLHLHLRIPTDPRAERSGGVTPAGGRAHGWMDGERWEWRPHNFRGLFQNNVK